MISRMMLSLKGAGGEEGSGWTIDSFSRTHAKVTASIEFARPSNGPEDSGGTTFDEVALSDLSNRQVGRRNGMNTV